MKRQPGLVARILEDMHPDVDYTFRDIAKAHCADPSLVIEILEKLSEQGWCRKVWPDQYRKVRQVKRRSKSKQLDWLRQ